MRFRLVKITRRPRPAAPAPAPAAPAKAPPQMDNPYSRHFTQPRTLDSLRRRQEKP